ncbi:transposase [Nostoc sp. NIES-3756]|uniref:transposase n=1 Tax=Nostoc sp. NIES-3756 TaxID=1751286 RepID=UPI0009E68B67
MDPLYLPPYSPDLNRIEKCWVTLKSRVRKLLPKSNNLRDAMETALKQAAS